MTTAANIRIEIEAAVRSGALQPGDRLPSVRTHAAELHVAPNTVAAAYKQLRDRGVVIGRGRQGTVVAPQTRPTSGQVATVPAGLIDAMRGSPDPQHLPALEPALTHAAHGAHVRYGDALLDPSFERAAREVFEADEIDATHLTATSGAMDAIEKILAANNLRPGDRLGVEDPGHVPVHQLARAAGLELVPIAVDDEGITPESLHLALANGLDALVVTPRAHNPTGAAFTTDRAAALDEVLGPHSNVLMIQDDHAGPVCGVPWIPLHPPGERHAVIRSFGKSLGPDLRMSVTAGDRLTVERVALAVSNGPGWVSHLLQRAAAYLLTDSTSVRSVADAATTYTARREHMIAALGERGVEATGRSGLNVWIPTTDEQAAVDAARTAGFAIRAADSYRVHTPPAVRVTVSALEQDNIDKLADALAAHLTAPHRAPAV